MKKRILAAFLAAALALASAGCGAGKTETQEQNLPWRATAILPHSDQGYWTKLANGMQEEAAGQNMTMFDSLAYALTGIMLLFLAAVKGSPAGRKGRYFVCFVLLMLSMLNQNPAVHLLLGAMVWPLLLALENAVGPDLKAQARAVLLTEAAYVIAWFLAYGPVPALAAASNLLGFLRLVARAWGILSLYKAQAADPTR